MKQIHEIGKIPYRMAMTALTIPLIFMHKNWNASGKQNAVALLEKFDADVEIAV
jgi:hypothetical protein